MSDINEENNLSGLEIAVIGMAGKFPGANNIDEFWENLKNSGEMISFISDDEAQEAGITRESLDDSAYVKAKGGVFEGKEFFDAPLFGYTPLEAEIMDPQTRKLHEGVWEALENAGYNPEIYDGLIGLYAGASTNFYWEGLTVMSGKRSELGHFAAAHLTGREFLTTIVSYKLNLKGPSFTVLTACSTSLVAIHLACQALLNGESHIALAGGVSIETSNNGGYRYQEGMILSMDGHCRAFDARANGTVMGNGIGVVVLKPLEDAIADNDYIHAVIKGTAINNDGLRKGGYSAPSIEGQAEVIRAALQVAEVEPQTIGYIETHGTGTQLGDPIEMEALKMAYGPLKPGTCAIGSVKTNIGHLDAAAGAAGFIKTVLCLKHQTIPPSLHFETPNPKIDFKNSPFYVNTKLSEWLSTQQPLRAGISSFGIGGTNAHVILEQWPAEKIHEKQAQDTNQHDSHETPYPEVTDREYQLILFSARTSRALEQITQNLSTHLQKKGSYRLADMAYTLQVGRRIQSHRRMLIGKSKEEVADALQSPGGEKLETSRVSNEKPPVVFMFPGQGSQYENMGYGLYRSEPLFRKEMDRCFEILHPLMENDIKGILYPGTEPGEPDLINQTQIAQPLLFIFEYAMAKLMLHWGIEPYAMIGHSIGEYVAAHLSGVFSLEDAIKLVTQRGKLMQGMPQGAMLGVSLPAEEIEVLLKNRQDISIAAVNSPSSCVVSGPGHAIDQLARELRNKNCNTRNLQTSHAFHSPMMAPIAETFRDLVEGMKLNPPNKPYLSNVSGTWITVEEATSPQYWSQHLLKPVLFARSIEEIFKREGVICIEVGPGKVLTTFVHQHPAKGTAQPLINLVRHPHEKIPDHKYLTEKVGLLWLSGINVDWNRYHENRDTYRVPLPTYPFEKKRYWIQLEPGTLAPGKPGGTVVTTSTSPFPDEEESETLEVRPEMAAKYIAPENETERKLVEMWQGFFGLHQVGIRDDFFQLGGDSLKATALSAKIQQAFDIEFSFTQLFNTPTIKGLAQSIEKAGHRHYRSLEAVEKREYYPLSSAQKRLYLLQKMGINSVAYNLPNVFILKGEPDKDKLTETFKQLLNRHAALRTSFTIIKGEPVQIVHEEVEFKIIDKNPEEETEKQTGGEMMAILDTPVSDIVRAFIHPFDLAQAPLLRVGLMNLEREEYLLIIDLHHIVTDGASQAILTMEFMSLYAGKDLPPLRLQYKDFSHWQQSESIKATLKKQEEYWLKEFSGEIQPVNLPTDFPRPEIQSFEGNAVFFKLAAEETKKLHQMVKKEGTTLFSLLLAIFNLFLSKICNQDDLVVGIPVAGRRHVDLQQIIGMFVNTLAIRNTLRPHKTFIDFLEKVKVQVLQGLENQDYPFEDLVEQTNVQRDMSRNPLFNVMFVLQNTGGPVKKTEKKDIDGLEIKPYVYEHQAVKFDMTLTAGESEQQIHFNLQYSTKLFKKETISRLIGYFRSIISTLIENPRIPLADVRIISQEEKKRILEDFNDTQAPYHRQKTIHDIYAQQAEQNPGRIGLAATQKQLSGTQIDTGHRPTADSHWLTYGELNKKSGLMAAKLQSRGLEPDNIAALIMEPGVEMMVSILGIFKAGGAYMPIETGYPQERINYMLADSGARILLKNTDVDSESENRGVETISIDEIINNRSEDNPVPAANSDSSNLAYVIYTSGTTGKPKGVLITHENLVNYSHWFGKTAKLTHEDNALLTSSYAFDLGYTSIYPPLLTGGGVHLVNRETYMAPERLMNYILLNRITYLKITPSLLSVIVQHSAFSLETCKYLRLLVVGGEAINLEAVEQARRECGTLDVINHYGPTEATIGCIANTIDFDNWEEYRKKPVIGNPVSNTCAYIMDRHFNLLPIGITGELCVSGTALARGYLNRPELTSMRFCLRRPKDSFRENRPLETRKSFLLTRLPIYRTGDLARWQPDGNIQFLGRIDTQIKIRGFRIETEEIEKQLLLHQDIEEAVVLPRDNENKEKFLCAYVVANKEIQVSSLREQLLKHLPDYMVPSYFVFLEQIPLTPNGKVNKKALESLDAQLDTGVEYVAPENNLEKTIAQIWQEILHLEKVGIYDQFFEIGGNSLKLIQVNTRLQEELQREISVITLFEYTTIHTLAEYLRQEGEEEDFYEMVAHRVEDIDQGKNRLRQRMQKRGGILDD